MDDGAVAALAYDRECRRYSEEMFTWSHSKDTHYIFWTGPRDFILENPTVRPAKALHLLALAS